MFCASEARSFPCLSACTVCSRRKLKQLNSGGLSGWFSDEPGSSPMMRVAAGVPMSASTKKSNCAASLTLLKLRSNRNRFAEGDKMKETECFAKPGEISIDNRHSVYCVRSPLLSSDYRAFPAAPFRGRLVHALLEEAIEVPHHVVPKDGCNRADLRGRKYSQ